MRPTATPVAKIGTIDQNSIGCTGSREPRPTAADTPFSPSFSSSTMNIGASTRVQPIASKARALLRTKKRPRRKFQATSITPTMTISGATAQSASEPMIAAVEAASTPVANTIAC